MASLSALAPHIRARAVTALAVTSAERSPVLPNLPTLIETGIAGYVVVQWQGVLGPAGTPAAEIERFQLAIAAALRQPEVARSLSADGSTIVASTPAAFKTMMDSERVKWTQVLERAGLRAF
jgi:tripartite-type tricarboxylate transporter receptor subunit TctC